jgi:DnaJ like chaperone protein
MKFMGKLIGAILGFAFTRNVIGVAVGMALGHAWDQGWFGGLIPAPVQREGSFVGPLFAIAGAIAKADGRVSEQEVATAERLMDRLGLQPRQRKRAIEQFNKGKQFGFDVHRAARELRAFCGFRGELKLMLLEVLADVAIADGGLHEHRHAVLSRVARSLDLSEETLNWVLERKGARAPRPPAERVDPYTVLGVARDASEGEIRRSYRRLIAQYHPDKLSATGASPEALREAEGRAAEINAAYERIKELRGL